MNEEREAVIEIDNLTKHYGDVVGVQNLSLKVHRGEIMGFLGPNGAGKTTTLRSCLDLLSITAGEVRIFGMDSHQQAVAIRQRTGYLPGDFGLLPGITTESYLRHLLALSNCRHANKMHSLAERLDLDLSRKTNELSKGNRQKVGIIQALMADQELVILDEPTAGLDPLMQQEVYRILREENQRGSTIFMSSHILAEVEEVCHRVAIIRKGHLEVVEDIAALQEKTGKVLEVEFREEVDLEELDLPGVSDLRREDGKIMLTVHENLDRVIKAVSSHKVLNMQLSTYSLEQLFLKYYGNQREKNAAETPESEQP
ncbi:MAG: ABC transporter ATP-binding protein [Thermoplasmatota archaeon]